MNAPNHKLLLHGVFRRSRLCQMVTAVALAGMLWLPHQAAALDAVTVVLSEEGGAHAEVAEKLRSALAHTTVPIRVVPLQSLKAGEMIKPGSSVIVAVGTGAMQALAQQHDVPVMNVLVPRQAFEKIARQDGRNSDHRHFSAIYLDQPFSRQLNLIRLMLPEHKRVGVLLGPDSAALAPGLRAAARQLGIRLMIEKCSGESELFPALHRLLNDSDVLLAVPDSEIYNRNTIQGILLTTYRHKVPLIGFSPAYVKAGALAAAYSTPAQIGRQTADMLQQLEAGRQLPPPQSPRYFSVGINAQVARSLGLVIDEATLNDKLKSIQEPEL